MLHQQPLFIVSIVQNTNTLCGEMQISIRNTALLYKLMVSQVISKFPILCGVRKLVHLLSTGHTGGSCPEPDEFGSLLPS
jgi:hypothetical protein